METFNIFLKLSFFFIYAYGHGYLSEPPARNLQGLTDTPQGLAAGGPGMVYNDGYRHGQCGDAYQDKPQKYNRPQNISATYVQGSVIELRAFITAHHMGFFRCQICNKANISEECFFENQLMRYGCTDKSNPNCFRLWLKLVSSYSWLVNELGYNSGYIPNQPLSYKWRVQLPEDLVCSNCVLRWHYYSTNSCPPKNDPPEIWATSEEFFNCADITIKPRDGSEPPDTSATTDEIEALLNEEPRNLYAPDIMDKNMWAACPERGLGFPEDYDPITAQYCWNVGDVDDCEIPDFEPGTSTPSSSTISTVSPPPSVTEQPTTQTSQTPPTSPTEQPTPSTTPDYCKLCEECWRVEENAKYCSSRIAGGQLQTTNARTNFKTSVNKAAPALCQDCSEGCFSIPERKCLMMEKIICDNLYEKNYIWCPASTSCTATTVFVTSTVTSPHTKPAFDSFTSTMDNEIIMKEGKPKL